MGTVDIFLLMLGSTKSPFHTSWASFHIGEAADWVSRHIHLSTVWEKKAPFYLHLFHAFFNIMTHPFVGSGHISPCGRKKSPFFFLFCLRGSIWWASIGKWWSINPRHSSPHEKMKSLFSFIFPQHCSTLWTSMGEVWPDMFFSCGKMKNSFFLISSITLINIVRFNRWKVEHSSNLSFPFMKRRVHFLSYISIPYSNLWAKEVKWCMSK